MKKILIIIVSVIAFLLIVEWGSFIALKLPIRKIKVQPSVFDMGNENYCVIFVSSLTGTTVESEPIKFRGEDKEDDHVEYSGGWAASSLTLKDGTIKMLTINTEGEVVLDKTITVE